MLLLARQPQRVLAPILPLLVVVALAAASSGASEEKPAGSSSRPARLDHGGSSSPESLPSDDLGFAGAGAVLEPQRPAKSGPNRIPFQLDFTTFPSRFARSPEASNAPKIDVSTASSSVVNITRRYRRDDVDPCAKFSEDSPKREFFSPGYPDPYPKNISCFKVLEADPGMVLKVEFRDNFELEDQQKCAYDYLEVRDGKYGYSRLIGKFCRAYPFPEITSSSRYLWLHFRSDNTIQGSGFRAVWSMLPRPSVKTPEPEECMLNITNALEYEIKTSATEIKERKATAAEQGTELDCIWNITVPKGYKIQITFPQFHLDKPNECDINFVQVYDKEPKMLNNPTILSNFCGSIADLVTSKGTEAYLRFFVTKSAINSSFEAIMTAIREKGDKEKDKGCRDNEFDCQDSCISIDLKCNKRPNCRYRFDEDADVCDTEKTALNLNAEHIIIILVVLSLLLSGLFITCIYNCMKNIIRDHKIIKEHIRQSRENRLDELGRKATPCSMIESCTEIGEDVQRRGSKSPSLEMLANPKELVSPVTIIGRDYTRERSMRLSVDLNDIHQSNNVSNATQERLQESSEERETRDMECQTRESIFDVGFILKPQAHSAFTTFGYQTPTSSRKGSDSYHPTHHYHHHKHPHYHGYHHHQHSDHSQVDESTTIGPPIDKHPEWSPTSRRCSVCHPHSSTPIVRPPHGWSAHESMYNPEDLASLQRFHVGSPLRMPGTESREPSDPSSEKLSPRFITRQKTIGSGENYGFIYGGEEKEPSDHLTPSSGSSSQKSGGAKPVKCPQVLDSRFKTEAIIEVDQKRPFSIESTKSAPDVIATH